MTPAQFYAHADTVIDRLARFDPVWATNLGIHNYDSLLADYSESNVKGFVKYLHGELKALSAIDTAGWTVDQKIDLRLITANIKAQIFQHELYPYWRRAPFIYSDQCLQGIYYLALRDFAPLEMKFPALLGRLRQIPKVCRAGRANLKEPAPIFVETAIEAIDGGTKLIDGVCNTLCDSFPSYAIEINSARDIALKSLREFNAYCVDLKNNSGGNPAIGRSNLEYLLSEVHLLDIDPDSLSKLGANIYAWADSQMKALKPDLPAKDTTERFPIPCMTKEDIIGYYQWEIYKVKEFVEQNGIAALPSELGECIPMETPPFLRGTMRGIAYEPPGVFDLNRTGYFYVRPLPDTFSAEQKGNYLDYIHKRGFRGSVVHEAFPGHHMQLLLANRHESKVRKIQQNLIFVEGWALYCEEMAYRERLFGENPAQWYGILGGIRFRAVRIIVDIDIHSGRMTPDSAMAFMNAKLGDNPYYYTAEIRRYCANPTSALSYLTGKTLIMSMLAQAQKQIGDSFRLGEFHAKLLSEGSIPPSLIAEKYGWRESGKTGQ
jgi:uncharacterized protein (DUF885 family)